MNIILLGPPGAGKGTQGAKISERLSVPIISTGNIIREAVRNQTPMGLEAKSYMESGGLVPDATIIGILKERLAQSDCEFGFILDGVPRTVAQADAIAEMGIAIDRVICIDVPSEVILERMTGRRSCPACGETYHIVNNPPKKESTCDKCGAELIIRADDNAETVEKRLKTYFEQTEPLIEYYKKLGKIRMIDGTGPVSEITRIVMKALED